VVSQPGASLSTELLVRAPAAAHGAYGRWLYRAVVFDRGRATVYMPVVANALAPEPAPRGKPGTAGVCPRTPHGSQRPCGREALAVRRPVHAAVGGAGRGPALHSASAAVTTPPVAATDDAFADGWSARGMAAMRMGAAPSAMQLQCPRLSILHERSPSASTRSSSASGGTAGSLCSCGRAACHGCDDAALVSPPAAPASAVTHSDASATSVSDSGSGSGSDCSGSRSGGSSGPGSDAGSYSADNAAGHTHGRRQGGVSHGRSAVCAKAPLSARHDVLTHSVMLLATPTQLCAAAHGFMPPSAAPFTVCANLGRMDCHRPAIVGEVRITARALSPDELLDAPLRADPARRQAFIDAGERALQQMHAA
jgi:hypothetical protein